MISPLFHILERNLSVGDEDRPERISHLVSNRPKRKLNRKTSQCVIDAWLIANELVQSGMNRSQAAKAVALRCGVGRSNLACNWNRIEAAAKAQINQGEDHGEDHGE